MDRGFFIALKAVRRQLAAMPSDLYELRLIHSQTRRAFPIQPLWPAFQLSHAAMVGSLRQRNGHGYDVYIRPYAADKNAGYILLDLDRAAAGVIGAMRANGHQPCVLLQTSPGHLQAWVRVSPAPIEPAVATHIGKQLARRYGGDLASTDWRHLGRLAGFANQKPIRRRPSGRPAWVKLLHTQIGFASDGASLVEIARRRLTQPSAPPLAPSPVAERACALTPAGAARVYSRWLTRLRIPQRFPRPDWSIADLWIAKALLRARVPAGQVQAVLALGSPGFPRRHGHPADYLGRTLARATLELQRNPFPASTARLAGNG